MNEEHYGKEPSAITDVSEGSKFYVEVWDRDEGWDCSTERSSLLEALDAVNELQDDGRIVRIYDAGKGDYIL